MNIYIYLFFIHVHEMIFFNYGHSYIHDGVLTSTYVKQLEKYIQITWN